MHAADSHQHCIMIAALWGEDALVMSAARIGAFVGVLVPSPRSRCRTYMYSVLQVGVDAWVGNCDTTS